MKNESGSSLSYWMDTAQVPAFEPLKENVRADVCVVGGGIAGLTTAYLLARDGANVVLVEDGRIASGETERTTAHITNVIDDRYYEIERLHGNDGAKEAAAAQTAAIDTIERIIKEENIDCDFLRLPAYLFFNHGQDKEARKELEACNRVGVAAEEAVLLETVPRLTDGRVLRFDRQAQFHALRYIRGLVEAAVRRGVRVYTQTHANEIDREDGLVEVETSTGGKVICNDVVVATNSPVSDLALVHIKQSAYRTFVVAGPVPKGSVPLALYWDNDEPYHYVRLQPEADHDVLIIGGEDHKTGQEDDANERYTRLENWARLRFPMLGEIKYRWSGQVVEPIDGLGYIGHEPEGKKNQYIITGDSGMGMTHATLGATIVRDLILGRENPWANVYRAGRLNLKAGGEMLREDLNMAAQYVDHVTGGDVKSVRDVPVGEGRVIRKGLKKYAVYKDAKGTMHTMSAVCTHLGCIVQWNSEEKTWDCPCHGSRFDAYGTVVNGPAIERLKEEGDLDD